MIDYETIYGWVMDLPIVDWHNHLDLAALAEDKPLGSLYEVWVKTDPYKHRAMRICGEPERVITGEASEEEKWSAWTRTLPKLVGNPLFAWAKMEMEKLKVESGKWKVVDGTAKIENISLAEWTPSKMLKKFNVEYLSPCVGAGEFLTGFTRFTGLRDERGMNPVNPVDPVQKTLNVVPSLRMNAGDEISIETLEKFDAAGCRVIDISVDDASQLSTFNSQLSTVAAYAATRGWTMLLHMGALRETSARLRAVAGPVGGFAGMRAPVDPVSVAAFLNMLEVGDFSHKEQEKQKSFLSRKDRKEISAHSASLGTRFARLGRFPMGRAHPQGAVTRLCVKNNPVQNSLPRTILMTLNPEAHAALAVLAGSFNEAGMPGKVQLGPAWWWCDHEEGIRDVLEKNAAYGVLSTFVGMTTDSRSLLSFVRHDYFRRVLCKWVAEKVALGAFPGDESLLRPMLENICYRNAKAMVSDGCAIRA